MEQLNLNLILNRENIADNISKLLQTFEANKANLLQKRGIYIYGSPGCGKTVFVKNILKQLGYDIIWYDAGDIRNKSIIDTITKHNMADKSVVSLFHGKARPIAIVMDEIDGMNSGDKGGINTLIKLMRPKKTKKQKKEDLTSTPIICISNYHMDKKIKELMKVCTPFELKTPSNEQIKKLLHLIMPDLSYELADNLVTFLKGDLRKLSAMYSIYKKHYNTLKNELVTNVLKPREYGEDTKAITKRLLTEYTCLNNHLITMNETDRTIVGLLWHENIIDILSDIPKNEAILFYNKILNIICYADYIDRVTFQKQIWIFNELSSLLKTFYNTYLLHTDLKEKFTVSSKKEIRFTKVLTKYSTEYNNYTYIQDICQRLSMDKKDMFIFFEKNRHKQEDPAFIEELASYDITLLDINRMYRYIDWFYTE